MKVSFCTVFRKDFIELTRNRLLLLFVLFLSGLVFTGSVVGYRLADTLIFSLILIIIVQYTFDSYNNDIRSGAALFLITMRAGFYRIHLSKMLTSLMLSLPLFFVAFLRKDTFSLVAVHENLILLASVVLAVNVTFCAIAVTRKSDTLTFFLGSSFVLGVFHGIGAIQQLWFQYGKLALLVTMFFLFDCFLYRSKRFRASL